MKEKHYTDIRREQITACKNSKKKGKDYSLQGKSPFFTILPVENNAAFNPSRDCCCQTLGFVLSAFVHAWGWSLLLLTVSHTRIWWLQLGFGELALQGMLSWPFLFIWPAAFLSNLPLAKWAGLKQICAGHRSHPEVLSANFSLTFYHLCSSSPSHVITQDFCFFMSEHIWCCLNLFQFTRIAANMAVKPLSLQVCPEIYTH